MEEKLAEYARLLVRVGLNVQKGQHLIVHAPVDCAAFARLCVKEGYEAGAGLVTVAFSDDFVTRQKFLHADNAVFDTVPAWQAHLYNDYAEEGCPMLFIAASDPQNLAGAEPDRILRSSKARAAGLAAFRRLETNNGFPWCIASVPIPSWAKQVFPEKTEDEAMAALWDAIFAAVRVQGDGRATERWREHLDTLQRRTQILNDMHIASLHYENSLGTDLVVRLPEKVVWISGEEHTPAGQVFLANMPTEEIFTAPLRDGVDGTVVAAMPLVNSGTVIRDFAFRLEKGKIVEVRAKEGEETLRCAIAVDEGASHFGEVALIPYHSPIRNQGILYYETLFDENASCHFAFGEAYPCVEGGSDMTQEQLAQAGLNHSGTHVDFMVGTEDLRITATLRDGSTRPIFVDGDFAF